MRVYAFAGILGCILLASFATGGDTGKPAPFRELATEDLNGLPGDWVAPIGTTLGWKGTLRAHIELKRNNVELSIFHHQATLRWDLRITDKAKKLDASASGGEKVALIPWQKDKQRYVQLLRDFQVQQKEFLQDVLEFRPGDTKAAKDLAALNATDRDTAPIWLDGNTWTLDVPAAVRAYLPKSAAKGPVIDWPPRVVFTNVASKG